MFTHIDGGESGVATQFQSRCVLGIDIGGTRTKGVALAVSAQGGTECAGGVIETLHEVIEPTPPGLGADLASHVADIVSRFREGVPEPAAVGVVVPGLVDDRSGTGVWSASLGWHDLPILEQLRARLPLPVAFGHDVRAGLLGEKRYGAARDKRHVLFVPIGTGIATAMMIEGRLTSISPWTGELGRVVIDPPAEAGLAPQVLEHFASARAIGRRWREHGRAGDARSVAEALTLGDELASRLWQESVHALVGAIAPVLSATGIDLLLLGGGLANAGDLLADPVRLELAACLPERTIDVRIAALGDRAAALGAAAMAADLLAGDTVSPVESDR